ncbi:probable protein phosphatase CG10417 [Drosophila biarmipes]|uniref:probable protein phosphatase CG10417 n=1 Tax=Drosophila biarmipes TaxID=125945 RepID=UPI0007E826DC|nr:probable protein phosphatase CG10417 [Drosophila biarmipes]
MGAYLSQPKTDKASTDEFNDWLVVGASSMQGWRNSQEDAHNSILNFDKNTSLFAVYDGHGGAEVAQYCADKFPEFLKNLESYKNGQFEVALKDAFLGFDKTLLDSSVVGILKVLAGEHNLVDDEEVDYGDDEDLAELQEESNLPLNEVLEKYKGLPQAHNLDNSKPGNEKNLNLFSSYLRGRRAAALAAEAVNKAVMDPAAEPEGSSTSAAAAAVSALREFDYHGPSYEKKAIHNPQYEPTVSITHASNTNQLCDDDNQIGQSNEMNLKQEVLTSSEPMGTMTYEKANTTESTKLLKYGSNDISKENQNGQSFRSEDSSKKTEKLDKTNSSQDDESTDDDDYEENDLVGSPDISSEESSEDCNANDDDDETDEDLRANDNFCANMIEEPGKDSGCTAVVSLLHGRDLYVANAGDSRCVISRNGRAIEMSLDHKPEDDEEASRIIRAGGRVTLDGRVNGGLNLSRALGDHAYKTNLELPAEEQMISALPDIKKLIITPEDEFMVLACDGIWNYMSSKEVIDFVRFRLKDKSKKLSKICEELFDNCLAPNTMGDGTGCDNMTAVIVRFKEQLQELQAPIEAENFYTPMEKVSKTDHSVVKRRASQDTVAGDTNLGKKSKPKRLKSNTDDNESRTMNPL